MFKLDNFGVILFVSFSYKKLLQCSFYEHLKNRCKNRFFRKNLKKFVYYNEELVTNLNFKRNYLENYNDSEHAVKTKNATFFMIFPNISFFNMVVNYWAGPLSLIQDKPYEPILGPYESHNPKLCPHKPYELNLVFYEPY